MMRGGTGLVGRAVAQFEARHTPSLDRSSRSLIPQPVRDKVAHAVEFHGDDELSRLKAELRELREHNELLEFRLLEKQSAGSDDVSDSGVSEDPLDRDHMERVLSLVTPPRGSQEPSLLSPLSMHESGIFDTILIETESKSTQTEEEDDAGLPELKLEVEKLLKFRETVCASGPELSGLFNEHDNRPKEQSCSQCTDLAQLVSKHETRLMELEKRCEFLSSENRRLDEERCELEEAENDARHISQRLESRVAALQEERALLREDIRRGASERASISRQARRWETLASQLEERNFELEEADVELRHRFSQLEEMLPGILVFTALMAQCRSQKKQKLIFALPPPSSHVETQTSGEENEMAELRARVTAYSETLRLADQLWAETERKQQEKLQGAEATLTRLRDRVMQLEEQVTRVRATCCNQDTLRVLEKRNEILQKTERRLQQHVHELEANELTMKDELRALEAGSHAREKRLQQEAKRAREETDEARTELQKLREELGSQLSAIKRRCETLRLELSEKQHALQETQTALLQEEKKGRSQRRRVTALLAEAECTNSELREEVDTLESNVRVLRGQIEAQKQAGERAILRLNLQLSTRDRELAEARRELEEAGAHEAGLVALAHRAAFAAHQLQGCKKCSNNVQHEVREVASQLRVLADIVSGRHPNFIDSSPEEEEEPPVPPRRHLISGSRVRAAQRALIKATKSAIIPCSMRPAELVAR